MNKILLVLTLLITPLASAKTVHETLKSVDQYPLRSVQLNHVKRLKAIYAMCTDSYGVTTLYRVQRTEKRGGGFSNDNLINLILYNGDYIPVHRNDCKFVYMK